MNIPLRRILASAVFAILASASADAQQPSLDLTGYNQIFADEFSGPLNISEWGPGTKWIARKPDNQDGWGTAKFNYSPPSQNPFHLSNGILEIRPYLYTSGTTTVWRSGLISSLGRSGSVAPGSIGGFGFAQRYGYFEARIKMPAGSYVWPAFWLLSAGNFEIPQAGVGEIDHAEVFGSTTAHTILHYWVNSVDQLASISSTLAMPTMATEYHTYGMLVKPDVMVFYIDGIERWQQPTHPIFNDPLFVLANYTFQNGEKPEVGETPQSMFIDYIRVYEAPPSVSGLLPRSTYSIHGVDSEDATNTAAKAIDGDYATAWTSASGVPKPHEIKIDLGSAKTVSGLRYLPRQNTGNLNDLIRNYEVRVSTDGSAWTMVKSGTWSNTPLEKTATFSPQNNIRYVSIKDVGSGTSTSSGAAEINIMSTTGGSSLLNLALSGTISGYSSQQAGFEAAKAIDGTDNTDANHWAAGAYPQWIEVDLGANKQIYGSEVSAYAGRTYLFRVETKAEGGSYQTVVDRTANTEQSPNTDYFAPVTARYVKLTVTGAYNYAGNTTNIREFEVFGTNEVPAAALTAYYTLNNLTTGIQNLGTDGATSNLSPASGTATPTAATGIIGGALSFDGNDILGAFTSAPPAFLSGNVGTDLGTGRGNYSGKYPFSISYWYKVATSGAGGTAVGLSQVASSNRWITTGITSGQPNIGRRNTTQYTTTGSGATVGAWHNVVAVLNGDANALLYLDGKLVATGTASVPMMGSNSVTLGGYYRSITELLSPFTGLLDDVGIFYNGGGSGLVLTPADAALINGLGRTGAVGLDQLASARALSNSSVGATAAIGGVTWERVSGLTGAVGDWGGSVANGDAFIVTGSSGNGIRVFTGPSPTAGATLTAYYTLNNLTTGIQNLGADGATSNLSPASSGATPTAATGMIGGALSFDGNDVLGAFTASPPSFTSGNAGADLAAGYPYSMSCWVQVGAGASGAAIGISQAASSDRYFYAGVSSGQPTIGRRNTTQYNTTASGVSTGAWHNVIAVFNGTANTLLYVDGKLAASNTTTSVGMMASNSFSIGAIYRSTSQVISPYTGLIDDVGVFYDGAGSGVVLTALDAALVNGLGRTGALGLDQLPSARNLANASVGTTATIGGVTWRRVNGLTGVLGDWGGSVSGTNAFIVTGSSGNGIRVGP